jgi:hypothetical protein
MQRSARFSVFNAIFWIALAAAVLFIRAAVEEPNLSADGLNLHIDTPGGQGTVIIDGYLDLKVGHMDLTGLKV